MADPDNRPLKDYTIPSEDEPHLSIVPPVIHANTLKIETFSVIDSATKPVLWKSH